MAHMRLQVDGQSGDMAHMRLQVDGQASVPQEIPQSIADLTQPSAYSYRSVAPSYAYAGYGYRVCSMGTPPTGPPSVSRPIRD
jgi:hypothetical protein